ncbi:hypothetical protein RUND412_001448 [Rhizina undulata]
MAEATGLFIGTLGIASPFSTCVEIFDAISEASTYSDFSQNLLFQIKMQQIRLCHWGESAGIWKPNNADGLNPLLNRPDIQQAKMWDKYGIQIQLPPMSAKLSPATCSLTADVTAYCENILLRSRTAKKQSSVMAPGGKTKLQEPFNDLREFNYNLHLLVPINDRMQYHLKVVASQQEIPDKPRRSRSKLLKKAGGQKTMGLEQTIDLFHRIIQIFEHDTYHSDSTICRSSFSLPHFRKAKNWMTASFERLSTTQLTKFQQFGIFIGNDLIILEIPDDHSTVDNSVPNYGINGHKVDGGERSPLILTRWTKAGQLSMLILLAEFCLSYERLADAEAVHKRVVEGCKRIFGDYHKDTLAAMHAAALHEHVMEARKRVMGEEHLETLATMHDLTRTYQNQDRFEEAGELYVRVFETRKNILGKTHPDTLATMNDLARMFRNKECLWMAITLFEHVMEARKRVLGETHPDTLATMEKLPWAHRKQDRLEEAESIYEHLIKARKSVLGEEHPDILTTMHELAWTYGKKNQLGKALKLFEQVREARNRVLGEEHPDTLITMHELAWIYEIRKRILGAEHPDTLMTMYELARTYRTQDRHEEAAALYEPVMEARKRVLGEGHPDTLATTMSLYWTHFELFELQRRPGVRFRSRENKRAENITR